MLDGCLKVSRSATRGSPPVVTIAAAYWLPEAIIFESRKPTRGSIIPM